MLVYLKGMKWEEHVESMGEVRKKTQNIGQKTSNEETN
jgi:hypothetical protein